jgi:hypothetical protein
MSRLDSLIRRLEAQRACLDAAAALVRGLPGPVLELGLGNGRTYDHLRRILPEREVFVFDRQVDVEPGLAPEPDHLFLGDIRTTLPAARVRFGRSVALVHSDIGTGDAALNAVLAAFVAAALPALLRPGGAVVSDQDLGAAGFAPLPLPAGVPRGRYFMYRAE